jgi:hypothetical protein
MRASIVLPIAVLVATAVAIAVVQGVVALLGFLFVAAIGLGFLVWIVGWGDLVRSVRRR